MTLDVITHSEVLMGKTTRKKSGDMRDALVFIDTCILLDFYRVRGHDGKLSILDLIDRNQERIITGEQIEMEYKKNRRSLILSALRSFKTPDWSTLTVPAFLEEAQAAKMIGKHKGDINKQARRIVDRLNKAMDKPGDYDPVYQCLQRLFKTDGPYNLTRKHKDDSLRNRIHALARRRHILGYPPRKPGDTSCGDCVNWEWIIHCATQSQRNVVIVSRDGDYGTMDTKPALNDWLLWEFKDRISQQRGIMLTDRLTNAFKIAKIAVTEEQIKEEDSMVQARSEASTGDPWAQLLESNRTNVDSSKHLQFLLATLHDLVNRAGEGVRKQGKEAPNLVPDKKTSSTQPPPNEGTPPLPDGTPPLGISEPQV